MRMRVPRGIGERLGKKRMIYRRRLRRRYLVRGGRMRIAEGTWKPTRIFILQFDSYGRAIEWWESPDYAPAKALRPKLANSDLVIVDGYDDIAASAG